MPTNPPRHSPVFPVVIIIFSVDWVSLEDDLARILPGGMHDISILRSLLFSWSDSPREEPTIHQMEETHGPPMKEVDGALVVRPQLLLKPSVFGLLPSPSVQLGSLVQWLSYLFRTRNFYLLLAGGGAVTWLLSAKRIWGGLVASPTLHPVFAWLHTAHLRVTHPLKNMPTAILFQDDSDVPWHALEMHIWDLVSYRSSSSNIYRGPTFMTNTNSSAALHEIGLSFGKFKVYICLRECYFYYLHFTNYEPEA